MKVTGRLFYLLAFSICICHFAGNAAKNKKRIVVQPEFADNGTTIDSLKKVFRCESIDFYNWNRRKTTDSCLTVCLINSTKVPSGYNLEEKVKVFKEIAIAVKKSLAKPQYYKSYDIIFVEKEVINGGEVRSHTAGMELTSAEL